MGVWPIEITPCAEMKYSRRLVVVVIPGCIGQPTPRRTYAHLFPPPPPPVQPSFCFVYYLVKQVPASSTGPTLCLPDGKNSPRLLSPVVQWHLRFRAPSSNPVVLKREGTA